MNELLFDIEYDRKKLDSLRRLIDDSDMTDIEKAHHTMSLAIEALKYMVNQNNKDINNRYLVGVSATYKHDKFYFYLHVDPSSERYDISKSENIVVKEGNYYINLDATRNKSQHPQKFDRLLEVKDIGILYWCADCFRLGANDVIGDVLKLHAKKTFSIGGENKSLLDFYFNLIGNDKLVTIQETVGRMLDRPIDIDERNKYISLFPYVLEKLLLEADLVKGLSSNKKTIKV